MKNTTLKLCLVTHAQSCAFDDYQKIIIAAVKGGVTCIQLREKHRSFDEIRSLASSLLSLLKPLNIPLIINDHVELAKEIDADGVHLGQSDMSPQVARKILGNKKIIGLSLETLQDVTIANQMDCINYVAASSIFQSQTKTDCKTIWGLEGLKIIVQQSKHPVVAIGGINASNVKSVMETNVAGIAVVSAIHDHPKPNIAAKGLIEEINNSRKRK